MPSAPSRSSGQTVACCAHDSLSGCVQEFAWAEEDVPKRRADRGSSINANTAAELAKEPMFCFEVTLALHLLLTPSIDPTHITSSPCISSCATHASCLIVIVIVIINHVQ